MQLALLLTVLAVCSPVLQAGTASYHRTGSCTVSSCLLTFAFIFCCCRPTVIYIIFVVRSICSPIIKLAPISITALRATLTGSSAKLRKCKQLSMSAALQVTWLHSRTRSMYVCKFLKCYLFAFCSGNTWRTKSNSLLHVCEGCHSEWRSIQGQQV